VRIQFCGSQIQALREPAEILPALRHVLIPLRHTCGQIHDPFIQPKPR
jgi:hypothetical protein